MVDVLPYLHAVVLEGVRLVDTIDSYQRRVIPKGGCMIEGYYLPAGVSFFSGFDLGRVVISFQHIIADTVCPHQTVVSAQPYIINRQADIFPNPETFNPDRWLVNKENYKVLYKTLWTFSSGPRGCIGKEFAFAGT